MTARADSRGFIVVRGAHEHNLQHVDVELPREALVGKPIVEARRRRLALLRRLGLGYLALERESTTLSAGEVRRLRLATQVGARLRGILRVRKSIPAAGLPLWSSGRR